MRLILLNSVFYFVLNMSIISSIIIVLLITIRAVFSKWIPKTFIYYMWSIALFRLLLPLSVPYELSLINILSKNIIKVIPVKIEVSNINEFSTLNTIQAADSYFPIEYKSNRLKIIFEYAGIIWLAGAVLFLIALIILYLITKREINNSINEVNVSDLDIYKNVRLYKSELTASPFVFGILKPKIIIPQNIDYNIIKYPICHEICHIKRYDNLWKMITLISVCIHWFNPFVWLFLYISIGDMEFSCDEKVLKNMNNNERKNYANALVSFASKQRALYTAFGGSKVKKRIVNIINYKKIPLVMAFIIGCLLLILAVLLITNPIM